MDDLKIERTGGLAGFGLPNSRLKSRGSVTFDLLSRADKDAVERLFTENPKAGHSNTRDGFTYRITWQTASGGKTIEVPESLMPHALTSVVKDEIE